MLRRVVDGVRGVILDEKPQGTAEAAYYESVYQAALAKMTPQERAQLEAEREDELMRRLLVGELDDE